ncbi:TlpA family protein disulfide reductase [Robiginitalea sediminis]|uniref:TlpA family protein disulfide reductase n=1 Tax=Robiginitalea sediminis TaxID=1982593 RepID=UPI000B4B20BC|nr:TlpA disulfide reductase family protein [Robiginitalea sediminis]
MKPAGKKGLVLSILAVAAMGLAYWSGLHIRLYNGLQNRLIATGVVQPKPAGISTFQQMPVSETELQELLLEDAEGQTRTAAEYPQKVLFINYWATWCAPCIAEMPGIHELYKQVHPQVGFVMINRDRTFQKAGTFLSQKEYPFELLQVKGPAPEVFRTGSIPLTLVVDRKNGVIYRNLGMADFNTPENKAFLNALLD